MLLYADVCYAVAYADNQECVSLLEAWPGGLLALLDEQGRLPRGSDEGFMDAVHPPKPLCLPHCMLLTKLTLDEGFMDAVHPPKPLCLPHCMLL